MPMQVHIGSNNFGLLRRNELLMKDSIFNTLAESGAKVDFIVNDESMVPAFWPFEILPQHRGGYSADVGTYTSNMIVKLFNNEHLEKSIKI